MGSAYFVGQHEQVSRLLQLGVAISINTTCKNDPSIPSGPKVPHILSFPRVITYDNQSLPRIGSFEGRNQMVHIVFRNQPTDEQHVFPWLQSKPLKHVLTT